MFLMWNIVRIEYLENTKYSFPDEIYVTKNNGRGCERGVALLGHSLGGSFATMTGHWLMEEHNCPPTKIKLITAGEAAVFSYPEAFWWSHDVVWKVVRYINIRQQVSPEGTSNQTMNPYDFGAVDVIMTMNNDVFYHPFKKVGYTQSKLWEERYHPTSDKLKSFNFEPKSLPVCTTSSSTANNDCVNWNYHNPSDTATRFVDTFTTNSNLISMVLNAVSFFLGLILTPTIIGKLAFNIIFAVFEIVVKSIPFMLMSDVHIPNVYLMYITGAWCTPNGKFLPVSDTTCVNDNVNMCTGAGPKEMQSLTYLMIPNAYQWYDRPADYSFNPPRVNCNLWNGKTQIGCEHDLKMYECLAGLAYVPYQKYAYNAKPQKLDNFMRTYDGLISCFDKIDTYSTVSTKLWTTCESQMTDNSGQLFTGHFLTCEFEQFIDTCNTQIAKEWIVDRNYYNANAALLQAQGWINVGYSGTELSSPYVMTLRTAWQESLAHPITGYTKTGVFCAGDSLKNYVRATEGIKNDILRKTFPNTDIRMLKGADGAYLLAGANGVYQGANYGTRQPENFIEACNFGNPQHLYDEKNFDCYIKGNATFATATLPLPYLMHECFFFNTCTGNEPIMGKAPSDFYAPEGTSHYSASLGWRPTFKAYADEEAYRHYTTDSSNLYSSMYNPEGLRGYYSQLDLEQVRLQVEVAKTFMTGDELWFVNLYLPSSATIEELTLAANNYWGKNRGCHYLNDGEPNVTQDEMDVYCRYFAAWEALGYPSVVPGVTNLTYLSVEQIMYDNRTTLPPTPAPLAYEVLFHFAPTPETLLICTIFQYLGSGMSGSNNVINIPLLVSVAPFYATIFNQFSNLALFTNPLQITYGQLYTDNNVKYMDYGLDICMTRWFNSGLLVGKFPMIMVQYYCYYRFNGGFMGLYTHDDFNSIEEAMFIIENPVYVVCQDTSASITSCTLATHVIYGPVLNFNLLPANHPYMNIKYGLQSGAIISDSFHQVGDNPKQ